MADSKKYGMGWLAGVGIIGLILGAVITYFVVNAMVKKQSGKTVGQWKKTTTPVVVVPGTAAPTGATVLNPDGTVAGNSAGGR